MFHDTLEALLRLCALSHLPLVGHQAFLPANWDFWLYPVSFFFAGNGSTEQ
jgi:hypothetical protein